jgi:hypothetical protein
MFHYETDITSFMAKIGTSGSSYIFSTHTVSLAMWIILFAVAQPKEPRQV